MTSLTELQIRCLAIMQRRTVAHDHKGTPPTRPIAWELGKTDKQTCDCLNRLRRKGLTFLAGRGFWKLTPDGLQYSTPPMPPGE